MEPRDPIPPPTAFDPPPTDSGEPTAEEAGAQAPTPAGTADVTATPVAPEPSLTPPVSEESPVEASRVTKRKPILSPALSPTPAPSAALEPKPEPPAPAQREGREKAEQLGLSSRENVGVIASARQANLRRTPHFWKIMAVTFLANVLVLAAAGYWLHQRLKKDIANRMDAGSSVTPQPAARADDAGSSAGVSLAQMEPLLKRLDDAEEQNRRQSARLEELASALAAAKSGLEVKKAGPANDGNMPSEVLTPASNELILLKERNRLTAYADESIATGARAPYERLWEALDDPRLTNLLHAARSEILRVQNFYLGGSRIDRFDIPVATYYPDDAALRDRQLKDEQLIKLLLTKRNPWEVRMKAANLLGTRRSLEVGDALVEAVLRDENLDVVKEATFSFEVMTGFHARIFDTAALEQWWKQFKATPPPDAPKPNAGADGKAPSGAKAGGEAKAGSDGKASKPEVKTDKGGTPTPAPTPSGKESSSKSTSKSEGKSTGSKTKKK